jgi:hypothetical protein
MPQSWDMGQIWLPLRRKACWGSWVSFTTNCKFLLRPVKNHKYNVNKLNPTNQSVVCLCDYDLEVCLFETLRRVTFIVTLRRVSSIVILGVSNCDLEACFFDCDLAVSLFVTFRRVSVNLRCVWLWHWDASICDLEACLIATLRCVYLNVTLKPRQCGRPGPLGAVTTCEEKIMIMEHL